MIRPSKYMDLEHSVVRVAATILSELNAHRSIAVGQIDEIVSQGIGETARLNLLPAINFLYLLGTVDYAAETDTLILRGEGP